MGVWLSWLERRVHIAEIAGSSPATPIFQTNIFMFDPGVLALVNISSINCFSTVFAKRKAQTIILSILALCALVNSETKDSCLYFRFPEQNSIISSKICTLEVESACENIQRIDFQARYIPANTDTPVIINLGSISRPPYKLTWNIQNIPNQLFAGVAFLAEAYFFNGSSQAVRREGIFFTHQEIRPQIYKANYEIFGNRKLTSDTINFSSFRSNLSIKSSIFWNEKELGVVARVDDSLFNPNLPHAILTELGIEFLIDTSKTHSTFPDQKVLMYSIPLQGKPYSIKYEPKFAPDGSFELKSSLSPCDFTTSVFKDNFKGYQVYFSIPLSELGNSTPANASFNLIIKVLDEKGGTRRIALTNGNIYDAYSPILWPSLKFESKPLWKNQWLIISIGFVAGLLIIIIIGFVQSLFSARPKVLIRDYERPEDEKQRFAIIKTAIENNITKKHISAEQIAIDLKMPQRKLNMLIKRNTGLSFSNYVMYSRTEVARERLRSSHSPEATIAEQCGFHDADEMEKYFLKFHHITPYKFRIEQQVA